MDSEVRNKDSSEKAKAKEYTDTRHDTQRHVILDEVLVTQKKTTSIQHSLEKIQ
jgi:hypothetical protein